MKGSSLMLFATFVLASGLGIWTEFARTQSSKEPPKAVSLTGCLVKGDEPKEVWLVQKDGAIYGLENPTIDLNSHLGHRVIVTGYVLPEEAHPQKENDKHETADFRVITLKMIGTTCGQ